MERHQRAAMWDVLLDVEAERLRQHARFGEQSLPAELPAELEAACVALLRECRRRQPDAAAWPLVLIEEALEAVLAPAHERRAELTQAAAVACQWVEALDREAPMTASEVAEGQRRGFDGFDALAAAAVAPVLARAEAVLARVAAQAPAGETNTPAPMPGMVAAEIVRHGGLQALAEITPGWDANGSPVTCNGGR